MANKKKLLMIFGTRPEAIKLAPIILATKTASRGFKTCVCVTSQHKEMLGQVLKLFNIKADYDLNVMEHNQSLFDVTSRIISKLRHVIEGSKPDVVVVQGDTTTAFLGALAAYYMRIPLAHVEAGLRTWDKYNPFPEEINRACISAIADYHFAPTQQAKRNLLDESVPSKKIFVTGNTVIDALMLIAKKTRNKNPRHYKHLREIDFSKRIILVTGHRRESFGRGLRSICLALKTIARKHSDINIVYPVHLNPNVKREVMSTLCGIPNIHLKEPMNYEEFVFLMSKSFLILTDSGGIQEEAPSLGKPVLVMRDATERPEAIEAGSALLVGTDAGNILKNVERLMKNSKAYVKMASVKNPYGDGQAFNRIIGILKRVLR